MLTNRKRQAAPSAGPQTGDGDNLSSIIGHLAQVQADLAEVITLLEKIVATENDLDKVVQERKIKDILTQDRKYVKKQLSEIADVMNYVYGLHAQSDVVQYRGDIAKIENLWDRITPDDGGLDAFLADSNLTDLVWVRNLLTKCKTLRQAIGLFTIPKRILGFTWEGFGVGAPLDFHETFKDELPDATDRVSVLRRLAELHVDLVGGMVDIERGMLYRVGSRGRRVISYLGIFAVILLGWGVIYLLRNFGVFGNLPGFQGANAHTFGALGWAYFSTIIGALAHIIKKAAELSYVERSQGSNETPQVILERLFLWLHVREYRFGVTVVLSMLVFGALVVSSGQLDNLKFLLAGYTVDSSSELVLQRFNTAVSAYTKEVKLALSPAATGD
jgi:hypothetical protein